MCISAFAHIKRSFIASVESLEMGLIGWEWHRKMSGNWEHLRRIFLRHMPPFQAQFLHFYKLRTLCMETVVWQIIVAGSALIRGTQT